MNSATLILLTSLCNGLFLSLGFTVGFAIIIANQVKGKHWTEKPIKLSRKQVKEHREEERKQQEAVQTMMHNIDVYDGTEAGQQDVIL